MPDLRRLFLALQPEPEVRRRLQQEVLRCGLSGRMVPEDNYHVTLVFLGQCDDERRERILRAAGKAPVGVVGLDLARLEFWPGPGIQALVPERLEPTIHRLYHELVAVLGEHGIPVATSRFQPHVTVSRRARPIGVQAVSCPPLAFDRFHLFESVPTPGGVRYVSLASWSLAGPEAGPGGAAHLGSME